MNIRLEDKTIASIRYIDGQTKVTFHGRNNLVLVLPTGFETNLLILNKLNQALKQKGAKHAKFN